MALAIRHVRRVETASATGAQEDDRATEGSAMSKSVVTDWMVNVFRMGGGDVRGGLQILLDQGLLSLPAKEQEIREKAIRECIDVLPKSVRCHSHAEAIGYSDGIGDCLDALHSLLPTDEVEKLAKVRAMTSEEICAMLEQYRDDPDPFKEPGVANSALANIAAQDVRIKRLEEALNDAVATILAVRASASGDDWAAGAGHFSQLCLETLLRIKNTRAALEDI